MTKYALHGQSGFEMSAPRGSVAARIAARANSVIMPAVTLGLWLSALLRCSMYVSCKLTTSNSACCAISSLQAAGVALAAAAKQYSLKGILLHLYGMPAGCYGTGTQIDEEAAAAAAAERAVTSFVAAALSGLYEGTVRYKTNKPQSKVGGCGLFSCCCCCCSSACSSRSVLAVALGWGALL
jgi:hypothetical protein